MNESKLDIAEHACSTLREQIDNQEQYSLSKCLISEVIKAEQKEKGRMTWKRRYCRR